MNRHLAHWLLSLAAVATLVVPARGDEEFSKLVGPVKVGTVKDAKTVEVPFITWGGDVATFHANGGLTTQKDTLFAKQGLNLKLVPGDDFPAQVKRYLAGESPFLRGTMSMLGQASEVIGNDPRTKAVVFLQLTWSAGDHMVARGNIKTLNELKGKKVVLQKGGPHVGMLDDILRAASLKWSDITVVWVNDLTGDKGPAAVFKKDAKIDACMVISPDMNGLTGGLTSKGTGAEGTVKDARVLISTATMSRSIADVYACRKDFFDANKAVVEKFTAGYLKACEDLVDLKAEWEAKKGKSPKYKTILQMTQDIYGKEVIPTLEVDAHGLISDATFVGLPGNVSFFTDKGNLNGFEPKQKAALDLAEEQKWVKVRTGFFSANWDYERIIKQGGLTKIKGGTGPEFGKDFPIDPDDPRTIYYFTINFEPNQETFDANVYGAEFQRVVELASIFGNAVIAVRGHADPTKALSDLVQAGLEKGVLKRSGKPGAYEYFLQGKKLDFADTKKLEKMITDGEFDGAKANPRETMTSAMNLSLARSKAVKEAIVGYAKGKKINLNEAQLQTFGVGIREPLIAKPKNLEEAKQNMRVEFRILRISVEPTKPGDFDF